MLKSEKKNKSHSQSNLPVPVYSISQTYHTLLHCCRNPGNQMEGKFCNGVLAFGQAHQSPCQHPPEPAPSGRLPACKSWAAHPGPPPSPAERWAGALGPGWGLGYPSSSTCGGCRLPSHHILQKWGCRTIQRHLWICSSRPQTHGGSRKINEQGGCYCSCQRKPNSWPSSCPQPPGWITQTWNGPFCSGNNIGSGSECWPMRTPAICSCFPSSSTCWQ